LTKGRKMFKKIMAGILILATSTLFGMSLNALNTANKAELMQIKGIGEKKADAILKERRKGKFKSFEDFQRVEGVGKTTAQNVKNDVKVKPAGEKVEKKTKKKSTFKSKKEKKADKSPKSKKPAEKKKK